MKLSIHLMTLAMAAALAAPVAAHEKPVKGPNGGQLVDSSSGHWELVANGGELTVHVTDASDKPVATKAAKGTATVLAAGKTIKVDLMPAEPNMLKGKGDFVAAKGTKVIVSLENIGPKPEQVRFTPQD